MDNVIPAQRLTVEIKDPAARAEANLRPHQLIGGTQPDDGASAADMQGFQRGTAHALQNSQAVAYI